MRKLGTMNANETTEPASGHGDRHVVPSEDTLRRFTEIARKGQRVAYSIYKGDADFNGTGLRPYAIYRDLGVAEATAGLVQAHVIRIKPPIPEDIKTLHYHDTLFMMMYVLRGAVTVQIDDEDPVTLTAHSMYIQPPGIKHAVLHYSPDFEVLEINLPADFKTVNVG